MGSTAVDQITSSGVLVADVDTKISPKVRHDLLVGALPGASVETFCGVKVVRWGDQILLSKQVTYLGSPWESFKKRIQIPDTWIRVHDYATWSQVSKFALSFNGYEELGDECAAI